MSPSVIPHLVLVRQGLSAGLEVGWQPASASIPPVFEFLGTGFAGTFRT